jgi:hypothetical protein
MKEDGLNPVARPAALWHNWLSSVGGRAGDEDANTPPPDSEPVPPGPDSAEEVAFDPTSAIAWERLWLATQRRPWRSLAVIPAGVGVNTPRIARALAGVGSSHLGRSIRIADATTITLAGLEACLSACIEPREKTRRVVIALGPVLENPASLALAQAADAAILCLVLGKSSISEAERTIEEVGRARFVGSIILSHS